MEGCELSIKPKCAAGVRTHTVCVVIVSAAMTRVYPVSSTAPRLSHNPLHNLSMPSPKAPPPIYQLRIALVGIDPPIWRQIHVAVTILLCCLHDAFQAVMGWTDSHLHQFEKDGKNWGVPEYDEFNELDLIDESKTHLAEVLKAEGESMIYVYDFGDDWRHEVVLERITGMNDAVKVPICLDGARRCPPEDVGGVPGYQDFLEVIFDPDDEERKHLVGWAGGPSMPKSST